jgi:hypothetical protein
VALLDGKGCAKFQQGVSGPFGRQHDFFKSAGASSFIKALYRNLQNDSLDIGISDSWPATKIYALDIDDEQQYTLTTRYCNVRIESILLDVNEKRSAGSSW